jgi:lipoprotein-anchoring transpeptidase ErfK/SrfK
MARRIAGPRASACAATALVLALAPGCGSSSSSAPPARTTPGLHQAPAGQRAAAPAPLALRTAAGEDIGARLTADALLRATPGGRAVATVAKRTEFGSPRILAVVRRRPGWLGVIAPELPNGRIGWIAERRADLVSEPVRIRIDLAERRLTVLRRGRAVMRIRVGVGAAGTPTPTGRFAVTDGLRTTPGSVYGCCILALSAHQPHIAQGWTGGDRIAVHGTTAPSTIGAATSNGCLHAGDADLRRLLQLATLGARVQILAR